MRRCAALPWCDENWVSLRRWRVSGRGRPGSLPESVDTGGREVHSCSGVPAAVAVTVWTVRGRSKEWRWSPLPGTPRCRCVRVCQSPVLIRGPGRRRARSDPLGGLPLQEVADGMKVMYEHQDS